MSEDLATRGHRASEPDVSTAPPLTLHRTLGPGQIVRPGTFAPYRSVEERAGESHTVRPDLTTSLGGSPSHRRALLTLAHLTDLQLADVQSPVRFEFFNREFADPRFADLIPVQRPQEAMTAHVIEATIATLNRIPAGPATGAPLQLAVTTGDAIDNAQWNELQAFLALFDGGLVRPGSGRPGYRGVQQVSWPDDVFWRPDGPGPDGADLFRTGYGFPHRPGLLRRAMQEFTAGGLSLPWLACYGNHEALIQGVGVIGAGATSALVGDRKPTRLPGGIDLDHALELFITSCEVFLGGEDVAVIADAARRPVSRKEFVQAHFRAGAWPGGHGFTERNRLDGTAYYCHDLPAVRLIGLDTTCLAGAADGSLDTDQARWLEERLAEVHGQYRASDGSTVRTGQEDRLVVIFSHHGLDTLTNLRSARATGTGEPVVGAAQLEAMLHRFPNVVLWLNGHTHTNGVRARRSPDDSHRGFWEVTTSAVVDWPCQTRLLELVDEGDGTLSIVCTMVDHDSPLAPASTPGATRGNGNGNGNRSGSQNGNGSRTDRAELAALHRELAGNVPWAGFGSGLRGGVLDRNVALPLRAPFPLHRLPGL